MTQLPLAITSILWTPAGRNVSPRLATESTSVPWRPKRLKTSPLFVHRRIAPPRMTRTGGRRLSPFPRKRISPRRFWAGSEGPTPSSDAAVSVTVCGAVMVVATVVVSAAVVAWSSPEHPIVAAIATIPAKLNVALRQLTKIGMTLPPASADRTPFYEGPLSTETSVPRATSSRRHGYAPLHLSHDSMSIDKRVGRTMAKCLGGKSGTLWPHYSQLTDPVHAVSDHAAI